MRTVETPRWTLTLPGAVTGRHVTPPGDSPYSELYVAHGWAGDAWLNVAVTLNPDTKRHLRQEMLRLAGEEGDAVEVPGARGARRAAFTVDLREDPGDPLHRAVLILARGRDALVGVTVRSTHEQADLDAVAASLTLRDG